MSLNVDRINADSEYWVFSVHDQDELHLPITTHYIQAPIFPQKVCFRFQAQSMSAKIKMYFDPRFFHVQR